MIRENKKAIIIAAIVMLIPVILGSALWNELPEQLPIHWNAEGEVDRYAGRGLAIFGLNGMLFVLGAFCLFMIVADPKRGNISPQNMKLVIGVIPLVSVFTNSVTLSAALGYDTDVNFFGKLFLGIIFVLIGNFMPKMKQSYTVGIKLPWTLASEENWNRTHRFAGWIFIIGGLVILADAFAGFLSFGMYGLLIVLVTIIPSAYSYLYYVKKEK